MSTPPTKYLMQFILVDPAKLHKTRNVADSTVMTVTALVRGTFSDMEGLDARAYSRLINHNIADMARGVRQTRALSRAATGRESALFYYCARCARDFTTHGCRRCGINFELDPPGNHLHSIYTPILPARVAAYAEAQRHTFTHQPPRA